MMRPWTPAFRRRSRWAAVPGRSSDWSSPNCVVAAGKTPRQSTRMPTPSSKVRERPSSPAATGCSTSRHASDLVATAAQNPCLQSPLWVKRADGTAPRTRHEEIRVDNSPPGGFAEPAAARTAQGFAHPRPGGLGPTPVKRMAHQEENDGGGERPQDPRADVFGQPAVPEEGHPARAEPEAEAE